MLGRVWACEPLGRPHVENPHAEFPDRLSPLYAEALDGGGPSQRRRVVMRGPSAEGRPYTHVLYGWRDSAGRRAVLSAISSSAAA
jgi:hypothetical protein